MEGRNPEDTPPDSPLGDHDHDHGQENQNNNPDADIPQQEFPRDAPGTSQPVTSSFLSSNRQGDPQPIYSTLSIIQPLFPGDGRPMSSSILPEPVLPPELPGLLFPGLSEYQLEGLPLRYLHPPCPVPTVEIRGQQDAGQYQFQAPRPVENVTANTPNLDEENEQQGTQPVGNAGATNTPYSGGQQGTQPTGNLSPVNILDLDEVNMHQRNRPIRNIDPTNNPNPDEANLHQGTCPAGNVNPESSPNRAPARSGSIAERHPLLRDILKSLSLNAVTTQFTAPARSKSIAERHPLLRDVLRSSPLRSGTTQPTAPARSESIADRHPLLRDVLKSSPSRSATTQSIASSPARSIAQQHPILSGTLGTPPLNARTTKVPNEKTKRRHSNGISSEVSGADLLPSGSRTGTTSLQSPQKKQVTSKHIERAINQLSSRESSSGGLYVMPSYENPPATTSSVENTDRVSVTATIGGDTPMVLSPESPDTADESVTAMIGSEVHSISSSDVLLLQSDDSQQVPEASPEDMSNIPSPSVVQSGMPSTSQTGDEPTQGESTRESFAPLAGYPEEEVSPGSEESPLDLSIPERVPLPRMPSLTELFRTEMLKDDKTLRDRRCVSTGSLRQEVSASEQQRSSMTRERSQPSSETSQTTDTDTPSEVTQNSSSGQTMDPNQQIQSSEEDRNAAVPRTSEPITRTSESNSSGIPRTTGESTSYEQVRSPNQQIPPEGTESVGAGEPNRARQSSNSDISRNVGQSSSSGEHASSATTQQNLVSKHRRKYVTANEQGTRSDEDIPRDIYDRSISQILKRYSEYEKTVRPQRDQLTNVTSKTSGQKNDISKSTNKASSSEENQSTSKKQSKDQNTVPQQISLTEQRTTSSTRGISEQGNETRESSDRAGNKTQKVVNRLPEDSSQECRSRARRSERSTSREDTTPCQRSSQSEDQDTVPQQISQTEQRTTDSTRGISGQGNETRESTDRAGNKTQKVVNRRPEDSSQECRSRARRSECSTSRGDTTPCQRSNQSEEARAIIPEGTVDNAIRNLFHGIVDNPALRLSGAPLQDPPPSIRTNRELVTVDEHFRGVMEIRDSMERLTMQDHASDNPNSEERRTDRREVRGRGKQCFGKDNSPRGDGGNGGK